MKTESSQGGKDSPEGRLSKERDSGKQALKRQGGEGLCAVLCFWGAKPKEAGMSNVLERQTSNSKRRIQGTNRNGEVRQ